MDITLNNITKKEILNKSVHKKPLRITWNKLPVDHRVVLRYNNGCYIGIERKLINGVNTINTFYSNKATAQNSGETLFKNYTKEEEINISFQEKIKEKLYED